MKFYNMVLTVLLSSTVIFSAQAQNTLEVESDIEQVTVFNSSAEIVRQASKVVPAGKSTLKFSALSRHMNPASVQVKASKGVVVVSVHHETNFLRKQLSPRHKVVKDSIETLELKKKLNGSLVDVLTHEKNMVLTNKSVKGEARLDVEDLEDVADFFRDRLSELNLKLVDLEQQATKIDKSLSRLRAQERELNAESSEYVSELFVEINADAKVNGIFELSYIVGNAGWTPVYDVRAEKTDQPLAVSLNATVQQKTGVKWENVKLALSTGNPTVSNVLPELDKWVLSYQQPIAYRQKAQKLDQNKMYYSRSAAANTFNTEEQLLLEEERLDESAQYFFGTQVDQGTQTRFEIDLPYTIPSDGKEHMVRIREFELGARYTYFAIPKENKDVFLLARVADWEKELILSGTSRIYMEGTYIGESYINSKIISDTISISLGRDPKVTIRRENLIDFNSSKTVGSSKKAARGVQFDVVNKRGTAIEIRVKDQVPVSTNKDIEVEVLETSGGKQSQDGTVVWDLDIPPGQKESFQLKYEVKYPKDKQINL